MLRTPLLSLLGIEHPIIQAGMGTFGSGATLAAAVSEAGAIGSIGAAKRSPDDLRSELAALRELTTRPFIVNFRRPWLQLYPECLEVALAGNARAICFSSGLPGELVSRIHDHGALVLVQVQNVEQACRAADEGADIVIAQGAEAGGFGAMLGGLALVPQVVDALAPLPVVAAGGISDGRGLAAYLLLGAAGANIGTRFLASDEASLGDEWKRRIVEAPADETVHFGTQAVGTEPGVVTVGASSASGATRLEPMAREDGPTTGQGVGAIRSVMPAADIVAALVSGAEQALLGAPVLVAETVPA